MGAMATLIAQLVIIPRMKLSIRSLMVYGAIILGMSSLFMELLASRLRQDQTLPPSFAVVADSRHCAAQRMRGFHKVRAQRLSRRP